MKSLRIFHSVLNSPSCHSQRVILECYTDLLDHPPLPLLRGSLHSSQRQLAGLWSKETMTEPSKGQCEGWLSIVTHSNQLPIFQSVTQEKDNTGVGHSGTNTKIQRVNEDAQLKRWQITENHIETQDPQFRLEAAWQERRDLAWKALGWNPRERGGDPRGTPPTGYGEQGGRGLNHILPRYKGRKDLAWCGTPIVPATWEAEGTRLSNMVRRP